MASRINSPIAEDENFLVQKLERSTRARPLFNRLQRHGRLKAKNRGTGGKSRTLKKRLRRADHKRYGRLAKEFLALPENQFCICCTIRRDKLGENIAINRATEVHHFAGRIGRLLCFVPFFKPFCFPCRLWPHENTRLARQWGLLAQAHQWEVFPGGAKDEEMAA